VSEVVLFAFRKIKGMTRVELRRDEAKNSIQRELKVSLSEHIQLEKLKLLAPSLFANVAAETLLKQLDQDLTGIPKALWQGITDNQISVEEFRTSVEELRTDLEAGPIPKGMFDVLMQWLIDDEAIYAVCQKFFDQLIEKAHKDGSSKRAKEAEEYLTSTRKYIESLRDSTEKQDAQANTSVVHAARESIRQLDRLLKRHIFPFREGEVDGYLIPTRNYIESLNVGSLRSLLDQEGSLRSLLDQEMNTGVDAETSARHPKDYKGHIRDAVAEVFKDTADKLCRSVYGRTPTL
jgi:hypothetical protein